jgi:hypothetical protein
MLNEKADEDMKKIEVIYVSYSIGNIEQSDININ